MDDLFSGRLMRGERMVWSGHPSQGVIFTTYDIFLIPFSILWCGFAIFWTFGVSTVKAPGFFTLWGLMFVAVGLYMVFGRFIFDAWIRRGIGYAITNHRVLIARAAPFSRFVAIELDQLPTLDLREGSKGRGTIRFGLSGLFSGNRGMPTWSPALDPTPQFIAIDDVRQVYDLLQKSRRPQTD